MSHEHEAVIERRRIVRQTHRAPKPDQSLFLPRECVAAGAVALVAALVVGVLLTLVASYVGTLPGVLQTNAVWFAVLSGCCLSVYVWSRLYRKRVTTARHLAGELGS